MERHLAATFDAAGPLLAHVQLSDVVVGSLCTPDRAVPGDGHVPLEAIVRALGAAGYGGAFELELVGPRIEAEGYAAAISRAVASTSAILAAAGV
jgi:sugar phosphate isomerase/epimerase